MDDNPHMGSSFTEFQITEGILKRDNWTTEEVIEILKGQMFTDNEGGTDQLPPEIERMNFGINHCVQAFEAFAKPHTEVGALAYCPNNKSVYHIGPDNFETCSSGDDEEQ